MHLNHLTQTPFKRKDKYLYCHNSVQCGAPYPLQYSYFSFIIYSCLFLGILGSKSDTDCKQQEIKLKRGCQAILTV